MFATLEKTNRTPTRNISFTKREYPHYQAIEKEVMAKTRKNKSGSYKYALEFLHRYLTQPASLPLR